MTTLSVVLFGTAAHAATTIPATGPFPYVITAPGDYVLGGSIPAPGEPALSSEAIILQASHVRLDLAGHTITGSGCADAGIRVTACRTGVAIVGGRIEKFQDGIRIEEKVRNLLVHRMTLAENCRDGIHASASGLSGHCYSYCKLRQNGEHGIFAALSDSRLHCNRATESFVGIRVDGSDNLFWGNTCAKNGDIGLRLAGDRNGLARNRFSENGLTGLFTAAGSRDNVVKGNVAYGNPFDLYDQNLDAFVPICANVWSGNRFSIDNEANGPGAGCIR